MVFEGPLVTDLMPIATILLVWLQLNYSVMLSREWERAKNLEYLLLTFCTHTMDGTLTFRPFNFQDCILIVLSCSGELRTRTHVIMIFTAYSPPTKKLFLRSTVFISKTQYIPQSPWNWSTLHPRIVSRRPSTRRFWCCQPRGHVTKATPTSI